MKAVESNEAAMEEDIDAEEEIKMAERLQEESKTGKEEQV